MRQALTAMLQMRVDPDMEYNFTSAEADELNHYVIFELGKLSADFDLHFITSSYYNIKKEQ